MIKLECKKCKKNFLVKPYREKIAKYCSLRCLSSSNKNRKTHGMKKTKFYAVWSKIKGRCNNSNSKDFYRYGGRGIKVSKKWEKFNGFYNDMYHSYFKHVEKFGKKNTSIDRINNDGNYRKSNCRWATPIDQANNKRNNVILEYKGDKKTLAQWAMFLNINQSTLRTRINRGWSTEKTLTTLVIKGANKSTYEV